jgi:hypothetical protein
LKAQRLREDVRDPDCIVVKNVGIDPQRDGRVCVAEPISNHMNRHPREKQDQSRGRGAGRAAERAAAGSEGMRRMQARCALRSTSA